MPSHRKTKRKKKQRKQGKSGDPSPPRTTTSPTVTIGGVYECQERERKRTIQLRPHEGQKKLARQNFYTDNGLTSQKGYFHPDTRSLYNNNRQKFMKGDDEGADDYDFAVYCLLCALEIPETVLPPIEMQEVPGGFCINPRYVDTIENLHELVRGRRPSRNRPRPQRLDFTKAPIQDLAKHLEQKNKDSRDEILKKNIKRVIRFQEASILVGLRIKELACKKEHEKKRKSTIRKLLGERLAQRNYGEILLKMVMASIKAQHEYTPGRTQKRVTQPKGIPTQTPTRKKKQRKNLDEEIRGKPRLTETAPWKVPPRTRRAKTKFGKSALTETAPWMVPPWKNFQKPTLGNQAPATRRKGARDILPRHWQMTPRRPWKARPEYKKTKVGEPFQKWETTQKSRYKGNTRRRRRRRKTMERILRWEIGKRSKNKGKDKEKPAGHGNNKMIELAWMIPPWDLRLNTRRE